MRGRMVSIAAALLVISSGAAMAQKTPITVCTGPAGGNYQQSVYKVQVQGKDKFDFKLVDPTPGSLDNIDKLLSGECDMAPIQKDAWLVKAARNPQITSKLRPMGPLYLETVHLLCNASVKASRIPELRDGKHKVAIGPAGSGSSVTWDAFIAADESYKTVPTDPMRGVRAIDAAKLGDEIGCVLFTSALNSPTMNEANEISEGKLHLLGANDGDMDKAKDPKTGKPMYQYVDIPSGTYKKLQSGRVKSIGVEAIWVVRSDWVDKNDAAYDDLIRAKNRAQPDILKLVGQQPGS